MFPSSGYFRAINCPFFTNGLCERPYCHFRHSKPPEEKSKERGAIDNTGSYRDGQQKSVNSKTDNTVDVGPSYSTSITSYSLGVTSSFNNSSQSQSPSVGLTEKGESYLTSESSPSVQSVLESYSSQGNSFPNISSSSLSESDLHVIPSFSERRVELPKSEVDKIDRKTLPKISGLAKRRQPLLPSYNPTPKAQINRETSFEDIPKYRPTPKTYGSQSSSEYDPVKNFSFWPQSSAKDDQDTTESNCVQESTTDAIFSDDETDENNTSCETDEPTDSRSGPQDASKPTEKNQPSDIVPNLEELLTPSSYFTNKLSSLSVKSHKEEKTNKAPICSDSSTKSKVKNESTRHTSQSHYVKKSGSSHQHHHHSHSSSSSLKEHGKEINLLKLEKKLTSSSSSSVQSSKYHSVSSKSNQTHKSSSHKRHSLSSDDEQLKSKKQVKSSSHHEHSNSKDKHISSTSHREKELKHSSDSSKKLKTSSSSSSQHSNSEKSQSKSSKDSSKHSVSSSKHSSSSDGEAKHKPDYLDKGKTHHMSNSKHSECGRSRHDSSAKQSVKDSKGYERNTEKGLLTELKPSLLSNSQDHSSQKSHRRHSSQLSDLSESESREVKHKPEHVDKSKSHSSIAKHSPCDRDNSQHDSSEKQSLKDSKGYERNTERGLLSELKPSLLSNSKDHSSQKSHRRRSSQLSDMSESESREAKHKPKHIDKSKSNHASIAKHSPYEKSRHDSSTKQSLKDNKGCDRNIEKGLLKELKPSLLSNSQDKSSQKSHRRHSSQSSDLSESAVKKVKQESDSIVNGKHRHNSTESLKYTSSTIQKDSSQGSGNNSKNIAGKTVTKVSNVITSTLFGDESDGSDSDCQIVEPAPEPPPHVYELTDSDEDDKSAGNFASDIEEEDEGFSDSDTFDECLRIFQESERHLRSKEMKLEDSDKKPELPKAQPRSEGDLDILQSEYQGKKRMAHKGAEQITRPAKVTSSSRPRLSPAEVMHNRIVEIQKKALLRAARREGRESDLPKEIRNGTQRLSAPLPSLSMSASSLILNQKKREAHSPVTPTKATPNAGKTTSAAFSPNSFYNKKTKPQASNAVPASSTPTDDGKQVTIAGTASKTEKRKAHTPTQLNLKRPVLPVEFNAKVATNIRQRYLNLIIDEFHKFCAEEESIAKGLEEEESVYKRATNKNIYLHVAVQSIKKIRMQAAEAQPSSAKKLKKVYSLSSAASLSSHVSQSHEATLGGRGAAMTSFTLHRSHKTGFKQLTDFKGEELYKRLKKYILTEEQLQDNGFPRPSESKSSKAIFYKKSEVDDLLKDNERNCRRCGKRYLVDDDGSPAIPEQCIYHYGNAYKKKVAGSIDARYACCNERAGVKGCQVAKTHVNERNKSLNLTGYMKTLPGADSDSRNQKVLSLDCEMVYTKSGLELARLTVIGDDCSVVYESLVKPDSDIIDYNTRFSGITEKDMRGVTTTLRDVQAIMLSIASDKTILMGHSLESDLTALKIIHSTVVDTSIVFPHRLGLPYKRALKNLMVDYLQKIIQTDDGGHDSKEDAVACMQLMLHKIKEDAKREYRFN